MEIQVSIKSFNSFKNIFVYEFLVNDGKDLPLLRKLIKNNVLTCSIAQVLEIRQEMLILSKTFSTEIFSLFFIFPDDKIQILNAKNNSYIIRKSNINDFEIDNE